ncbi:hypothetical protein ACFL20_11790, partial [Spirochaetota bacterium]
IDNDTESLDCLDFALPLINECKSTGNLYKVLSHTRNMLLMEIKKIKKFHEYHNRYSMDILMSLKINPPVLNEKDTEKNIYLSDIICMNLYGKPAKQVGDL